MTTPGPIIYQNQPTPIIAPRFSWAFFIFRILSIILVFVILFMIFQAVMMFITRSGSSLRLGQLPSLARTPSLTLSPEKLDMGVGQTGILTVDYFTGSKTIQGLDLVIKYDPSMIEFTPGTFFKAGSVFTQYPITEIASGTLRVSAVATVTQIGFNGSGQLGTLQFKALNVGQTKVEIIFQADQTTESNLVELNSGQEVLQLVRGTTINIK